MNRDVLATALTILAGKGSAFLRSFARWLQQAVRRNIRDAFAALKAFLFLFVLTWGTWYLYSWRTNQLFGWGFIPVFSDPILLILGPLFLPFFLGFTLLSDLVLKYPLAFLALLLALFSPLIVEWALKCHRFAVSKASEFLTGRSHTTTEKFFGYALLGLAFGNIELVIVTSPALPSPDLGFFGIAQNIFALLFRHLLGDTLYSDLLREPIWALGFVSFSLSPLCILMARMGLVIFFRLDRTDQIRNVVNLLFIGLYASLLIALQVLNSSLFPRSPTVEHFHMLRPYHVGIWAGLMGLALTSLICSGVDNVLLSKPGLRLEKSVRRTKAFFPRHPGFQDKR
jgi:hypothetical protein